MPIKENGDSYIYFYLYLIVQQYEHQMFYVISGQPRFICK